MTDYKMLFAGFGGQGILFVGKVAVNAGLCDGKEVSWLPSYGAARPTAASASPTSPSVPPWWSTPISLWP